MDPSLVPHRVLVAVVVLLTALALPVPQHLAHAEGSKEWHTSDLPGGADRTPLDTNPAGTTISLSRQTVFSVYAEPGEFIYFASSALGNGGDVNWTAPGGATGTCSGQGGAGGGKGDITSYTQEQAGPFESGVIGTSDGYVPCKVTVGASQGGIWTFTFTGGTGNPTPSAYNVVEQGANGAAAWDVTVFDDEMADDAETGEQTGRVWSKYFALNMGANGRGSYASFSVLTNNGYLYDLDLRGMEPFGFIVFANNRGFLNTSTSAQLFRSVKLTTSDAFQSGTGVHLPTAADTDTDITHRLFINEPDDEVLPVLGVPSAPPAPPVITAPSYTIDGDNVGGTISFTCDFSNTSLIRGPYQVQLTDPNDAQRTALLSGFCESGTPVDVAWDGSYADGTTGDGCSVDLTIRGVGGEVHFPIIDPEANPNGFTIIRQNGLINTLVQDDLIYWNDFQADGTSVFTETGASAATASLTGTNSSSGAHTWSGTDHVGFDTWSYVPAEEVQRRASSSNCEGSEGFDTVLLPVELVAFEAVVDGTDTVLRWETASETNNAGFTVEHHEGGGEWTSLAFVDGHGTTTAPRRYAYRAANLEVGTHRFRLKQVDFGGTFEYSPVVEVAIGLQRSHRVERVYPNPLRRAATLRFTVRRQQPVTVSLYDALGRRVRVLFDAVAGAGQWQHVSVDGSGLASGTYLVRVDGAHFVETQRVTVVH